jgi:hypothetical protein
MTILEGDRHKDEQTEMQRSRSNQGKSCQITDQHNNGTGIFTFVDVASLGMLLEMKRDERACSCSSEMSIKRGPRTVTSFPSGRI